VQTTSDPIKNQSNRKNHGIDLAEVDGVFFDDHAITIEDRDHDEERFVTLGMDGLGRVLVVAYHYRGKDEIRIISARLAEPHERKTYEG
jgi:uncharacterized DUF497 family protein